MSSGRCSTTSTGKGARASFAAAALAFVALAAPRPALAAIGCTLSNPAEDLRYLYPEMTSYKEDLKEFTKLKDGEALFKAFSERLGSDLDPIYENDRTPYTVTPCSRARRRSGSFTASTSRARGE